MNLNWKIQVYHLRIKGPTVDLFISSSKMVQNTTFPLKVIGVSKNRGTPKWMVYNGKPY